MEEILKRAIISASYDDHEVLSFIDKKDGTFEFGIDPSSRLLSGTVKSIRMYNIGYLKYGFDLSGAPTVRTAGKEALNVKNIEEARRMVRAGFKLQGGISISWDYSRGPIMGVNFSSLWMCASATDPEVIIYVIYLDGSGARPTNKKIIIITSYNAESIQKYNGEFLHVVQVVISFSKIDYILQ